MEIDINNWLLAVVILPILASIFKSEIGKFFTAWSIYRLRWFDSDGNPKTSQNVQILNEMSGEWIDATIIQYKFTISNKKRGVYLLYPDGGREKLSFIKWADLRKRTPPPDNNNRQI